MTQTRNWAHVRQGSRDFFLRDQRGRDGSPICCKGQGTEHFLNGSGHFEQRIFWQLSEHVSCEPIWAALPQTQPFQSTFQTGQITDKNIRTGRTGVPPLQQGLTHSAFTSGLFQVIKLENCTVMRCQLLGRRVIPKETRPIEVTTFTLHRRGTSLAFPACSLNRTIHLAAPVWVQVLSTKPKQISKIVLKFYLRFSCEATLTSDLNPMTKGRQRIRPVFREFIDTLKPRLRRGPPHRATFEPDTIRIDGRTENIVADSWPMIASEVQTLLNTAILPFGWKTRTPEKPSVTLPQQFQQGDFSPSGRCNLCPRVVGTQIKFIQKFSQTHEFVRILLRQTSKRREKRISNQTPIAATPEMSVCVRTKHKPVGTTGP